MSLNRFEINGRTALVTGGAGLLGPQHAEALAECGATVVLGDVDLGRAADAAGRIEARFGKGRAFAVSLDVTSPDAVIKARDEIRRRAGDVRILVNNAAIDAKVYKNTGLVNPARFEAFALERWQKEIDVGLTGAFLCAQIFGNAMAENGGGVILNVASDLSVIAPDQRIYRKEGLPENQQPAKPVTYSVIKTALIGLTRYLAAYWGEMAVRVNALSPGGVYTDQPEEFVTRLTQLIPLGRMAQADEYRAAVQFLCSDASSYLTGHNLVMDGGRSVL